MPQQYTVPQFIDVEDKILGPLTVRQFVIMLAVGLLLTIFYKLFSFGVFLIIGLPLFTAGVTLSFVKINGQAFHFFLLNMIQTLRRPPLRVWDKTLSTAELQELMKAPPAEVIVPRPVKAPLSGSRLRDLILTVNTGGAYRSDEIASSSDSSQ